MQYINYQKPEQIMSRAQVIRLNNLKRICKCLHCYYKYSNQARANEELKVVKKKSFRIIPTTFFWMGRIYILSQIGKY